jgi:hypothetical protein
MQTGFSGGRRKRIDNFSQRRVENWLHRCIHAYCLNLFLFGWSENGPWGTPKNNVSELGSAFFFFFLNKK